MDNKILPASIRYNTFLTYKPNVNIEMNRKLKAECFDWDINHPKTLVTICIEKLSEDWMGYPKLDELIAKDREFFIQILNTDVPLNILVDNIKSDLFWKRCYSAKWTDAPVTSDDKKWINIYMERHFADILENINPRNYDPEKVQIARELNAELRNAVVL